VSIPSRSSRDLQVQVPALAQSLADEAGGAIEGAVTVSTVTDAVLSRHVISQALGIVMERYELNSTRAFEYLVKASQTSQRKLRFVAAELVTHANQRDDSGRNG
jgi:ANTAR domain-containing protein